MFCQRKDLQQQHLSRKRCIHYLGKWFAGRDNWLGYDSFLGNLYLRKGGKDLIGGHGVIRVFFPHRTLQSFYVWAADSFASISCFHCGLQLQSRRGGVKATKRTQVQVARVAPPDEFRILLKQFLCTWTLRRCFKMTPKLPKMTSTVSMRLPKLPPSEICSPCGRFQWLHD